MANFSTGHDGSIFEYDTSLGVDDFDDLLLWCTEKGASDITLQSNCYVLADIGGKNIRVTPRPLGQPEMEGIVRHIYGENGPGEIKSGYDLDPSYEIKVPGRGRKRYRVNITGGRAVGSDGIQITIRTLPEEPIRIEELGIEQDIIENFRPRQGMILVTGPTGSGKSTLLSSGIRMLIEGPDKHEKLIEYSKPVEYVYDKVDMPTASVHQIEVGRHLRPRSDDGDEESEFAYCVRNALRRKPTLILIGEARDKATIQGCTEAASTGHVLYSTMHTIGVAETMRRAVLPFPSETRRGMAIDILETMRMVVTQSLFEREGGGKVGCREYLVFDDKVRNQLLETDVDDWPRKVRAIMAEGDCKGQRMADGARKLAEQGLISDRTYRVVANKEG